MNLKALVPIYLLAAAPFSTAETAFEKMQMAADPRLPEQITEASGAAISGASNHFLWVVNDSGGTNEIHLIQSDGTSRGSVRVRGATNRDWEDLASFTSGGENFLMIADTGDNGANRESSTLYVVREPALPTKGKSLGQEIPLAWKIEFSWEGGPKDCEAVAVDTTTGKVLLVSKRTRPPEVHELPLRPSAKTTTTKKIGIARVMAPSLSFIKYRNQPTAMDISADGKRAVVATYYGLFVFERKNRQPWGEVFSGESLKPQAHGLPQAEAVALSRNDGQIIFTLSEGKSASILILKQVE